ncbi:MAG: COR domain-containing protein, partial [Acidimicrobiales bacterium]
GLTALPPEITQLTNLQTLYLNGNGLTALPPEIGQLTNLQTLSLIGNPLTEPPLEVANRGLRSIKEYFEQLESQGAGQLYEAKLLVVGEPGAGKTSLAKKLIDPNARLSVDEPTTRGIETWPWRFEYDGKTVNVTIWDFGGQDIYHSTHQFFLTSRSAYALVADVRREDTDFDYWLDVTGRLSNFSPLAIVNNEKQGKRKALDVPGLQRRYRHVSTVADTDLASNQGLEEVQTALKSLVFNLDHIGTTLPAGWVGIRGGLEELRSHDRDYLSWSEYTALCKKHEVIDRADQLQVASYLHDLGVCLHFADDHFLHKTIVLNSTWATDAVYRVLDDDQVIGDWGIFDQDDLNRVWHEERYADMQFELLQLMLRFRLCYQLPGTTSYLTPQLLSPETPNYQLDEADRYHVQYNYEFMPRGIIHQLIVRLHHLIMNGDVMWRTGVVFERDGSTAQVIEHSRSRRIDIEVTGGNTRGLTALVVDAIDRINASFENIGAQLSLPCICSECQVADKPELFDAEKLKKLARKKPTKECAISGEDVPIENLLDALTPVELLQRPQIYVSYKWEGQSEKIAEQVVSTFADHELQVIRDRNEVRYRDNIREFMDRLSRGDAIITIISDAYLKSENTMYELLEIYRLSEGPNDTPIFPIIMPDAEIYQAEGRASYLAYWDRRAGDLTKRAQELNNPAFGLQADLELFQNIRNAIAGIADLLKNMAGVPVDEMLATDFEIVREAVKHSTGLTDSGHRKGDSGT